ncbi:MAG: hypothetical protein ACREF7_01795 [Candidatus Saccharimonadales bacterium]
MANDGGLYNPKPDGIGSPRASSDDLKQSEQSFYNPGSSKQPLSKSGLYNAEEDKSSLSHGLYAAASLTPFGKAVRFVGKHKKGAAIGGGGATGFIIGILLFFGFIAAHELQTIEQDMLRYEDKSFSYVEKKAANKILKSMACRSGGSVSGCTQVEEEEAGDEAVKNTDPMTEEIDKFNFTDPNVESGLSNQDIGVNVESGKFSGLTDLSTGEAISASDFDNTAMIDRFQTAIPEWDVGQEATYRTLLHDHAGATFDVIPSPEIEDTDSYIEDSVTGVENSTQELADTAAEDESSSSSQKTTTAQAQTELQAEEGNSSILETADQGILKGETESQVLADAEGSISAAPILATTVASDLCSVDKAATVASKARIPTIISSLVRHSTTLISLADEMKVGGSMSGHQISQATSLLNGDPKADPNSTDPTVAQSALPFDRSAAWQRIEGNTPTSSNPDIASSALPTANSGTKVVNDINGILSKTGGTITCDIVSNSFISGIISAVQVVAGGISFGITQIGIGAAGIAVQQVLQHQVIPEIVKYFTPIGIDGLENSVQWMNNADAGSNLSINMYAQRMGGQPLSNSAATSLYNQGSHLQEVADQQQSFFSRTFSFSNPDSLFSKLLVHLPLSRLGIVNSIFSEIVNSPLALVHALGDLVGGQKVYAAGQTTNPGEPYGITQYGFNDSDINKYDPINNEYYLLHTNITFNGQTNTLINLLGNPNDFPNATDDLSTTDVFHCFSQGYDTTSNETAPDPICGTEGNFDTTLSPVPIGNAQIVQSFCDQLGPSDPKCEAKMTTILSGYPDLITRFRQYILDDEITGYYTSLMNNQ